MADPDGKERLTNNEFRELIPHLPLADLLLIEVRKEKWMKLIYVGDPIRKLYGCALCGITNSNTRNLNAHMDGKKHKTNISEVLQFYHPEYTYMKFQQRLAEGGSLQPSAKNSNKPAKSQSNTNVPKPNVAKETTPKVSAAATSSAKNVVASSAKTITKPVVPVVKVEKSEESVNKATVTESKTSVVKAIVVAATTTAITPTEKSVASTIVVPERGGTNKGQLEKSVASTVNVPDRSTNKGKLKTFKNPIAPQKGNSEQSSNDANKSVEPIDANVALGEINIKNNAKPPNEQFNSNSKKENSNSSNQNQQLNPADEENKNKNTEQSNLVKNPFAHSNEADVPKKPRISVIATALLQEPKLLKPEVIVIDDEEPPASEKGDTTIIGSKIPTIEKRVVTKPQENLNKRSTTVTSAIKNIDLKEEEDGPQTKKPKLVVNPAAVFLNEQEKEATGDNTETPNYQKDKVIIPTVDKNKVISQNQEAAKKRNEPKFSIKSFSSRESDDDIHGLIGVEYVVKIMKNRNDSNPRYECSLCELILGGQSMQNHLLGYNHRTKFCEKHFPTAISQYRQYCANIPPPEIFKVMTPILAKLAIAIEQHHGRDLPCEFLEDDFNLNRHAILSKLYSCRHASEQNGPSFTHVVDSKEIDEFIAQKDFFKPPSGPLKQIFIKRRRLTGLSMEEPLRQPLPQPRERPPSYAFGNYAPPVVDDDIHKKMVEDFLRGTVRTRSRSPHGRHRSRHHDRDRNRERRSHRSRERDSRSSRSGYDNARKSISPLRDGDIWQAYRHVVDRKINELNEVFKLYHSDPETHPMYNDEWQKFWKRRKDELIAAGLDHRSYNYQPEWVRYFKVRIEELYSQAVENIKIQSRERLCLPMVNIYLEDPKYHVQAVDEVDVPPMSDIYSNAEIDANLTQPSFNEKTGAPEVVPVLRLMTALEEHLGSLGPRIIDLMSKALLAEKTNPSEANAMILTLENCTLLETAMEKLKGVLYAGLLDGAKERAFRKVISDTSGLLSFAEEERKKNPPKKIIPPTHSNKPSSGPTTQSMRTSSAPVPVPVPAPVPVPTPAQAQSLKTQLSGITKGTTAAMATLLAQMDKKELAAKLAATLTAQGKTDFRSDQLEQLIAVYTLLEKKKREAVADNTAEASSREAASSSTTRTTLSDTLENFMNPSNPNAALVSAPLDATTKQAYTAATVNRYLDIMRRSGGKATTTSGGGATNPNDIWKNLQSIQLGLNMPNVNPNQNLNAPSSGENHGSSTGPQPNNFGVMNLTQLGFQTQNPYLAMQQHQQQQQQQQQQRYWQQNNRNFNMQPQHNYSGNTSGAENMFANTNNSSRVDTNNISINTTQTLQRNEAVNQQQNPNQKWRENLNRNNQNVHGDGGGSRNNAGGKNKEGGGGGGGGGQNKNRNNRKR